MCGTQIQGVAVLAHKNYSPEKWQGTLICWCVLLVALGINVAGGKLLPRLESLILVVHILGFFGIMIPLVYMSEHNTAKEVFTEFNNGGGFPTDGLSWFVGATGCVFAFAGGDAAVHVRIILNTRDHNTNNLPDGRRSYKRSDCYPQSYYHYCLNQRKLGIWNVDRRSL